MPAQAQGSSTKANARRRRSQMPTFATQSWLRTRAARAGAIATGVFGRWWRRGTGLGEGVEMERGCARCVCWLPGEGRRWCRDQDTRFPQSRVVGPGPEKLGNFRGIPSQPCPAAYVSSAATRTTPSQASALTATIAPALHYSVTGSMSRLPTTLVNPECVRESFILLLYEVPNARELSQGHRKIQYNPNILPHIPGLPAAPPRHCWIIGTTRLLCRPEQTTRTLHVRESSERPLSNSVNPSVSAVGREK